MSQTTWEQVVEKALLCTDPVQMRHLLKAVARDTRYAAIEAVQANPTREVTQVIMNCEPYEDTNDEHRTRRYVGYFDCELSDT
jgi:hypothetical protein